MMPFSAKNLTGIATSAISEPKLLRKTYGAELQPVAIVFNFCVYYSISVFLLKRIIMRVP